MSNKPNILMFGMRYKNFKILTHKIEDGFAPTTRDTAFVQLDGQSG